MYTITELLEDFNIVILGFLDKTYEPLEPELQMFNYKFQSGATPSVKFIFNSMVKGMQKLTGGSLPFQTPADTFDFTIYNEDFGNGYEVPVRELKRAAASTGLVNLNIHQSQIENLIKEANEFPDEKAIDMIEAGSASTYGVCFDGMPLFDDTHDFGSAAGTQDNLLAGTGVTVATLQADLATAFTALSGFTATYVSTDGNSKKRKLNKGMRKSDLIALIPSEMVGAFSDLVESKLTSSGSSNPYYGMRYVDRPFTDTNNWHVMNTKTALPSDRPILISQEEALTVTLPDPNDESYKHEGMAKYGMRRSDGYGYGAWYTIVKIVNA